LRTPEDLRHHRLIHDNFRIAWSTWLQAAGLYGIDHTSGVKFETAAYAIEAAAQGEGVLLGRSALVSADLASGRLVRPFDLALKSRWSYYVVYPEGGLFSETTADEHRLKRSLSANDSAESSV
jgi:LysR family glycine cleavage system transcriptional activator